MKKIAEKAEACRVLTLEVQNDGNAILWMHFPKKPEKDVGWQIDRKAIDQIIAQYGMQRL